MGAEDPQASRLTSGTLSVELARYRNLQTWKPKVGDFIIWHGWWSRWYGIVNGVGSGGITIIKENLPKLLLTMPPEEYSKNTIQFQVDRIRRSRGGEFHVYQDSCWFVDE